MDVGYYAPRLEPRKSSCPPYSLITNTLCDLSPSNKRTTAGCSCSGPGGSVIKPLRHLARQEGGLGVSLEARLLLLRVIVPVMMWWLHSLRLEVAVVQQQLHLLRAPMRVHSHRRVRTLAAAQPQRNEQALPVERLCKFYPSGDMSGSVPVYVAQGFHTFNQACLTCSPVSIVSRNRSGAAKPQ
jgi:hypothetical protein